MTTSPTRKPSAARLATFACEAAGDPAAIPLAPAPDVAQRPAVDRTEWTAHRSSRNGARIDHIVIHYTTSRNIEGTITHFKQGTPRTSAHYIIGRDGQLVQMVPDRESALHAGTSAMNARSIGIEHVARVGDAITEMQARTSIALIKWLMHAFAIPAAHVIPHACVKATSCCGDLFKAFGGGAGLPCARQKAAVHGWLAAHGITEGEGRDASPPAAPELLSVSAAGPGTTALSSLPSAVGRRYRARTAARSVPRQPRSSG